MKKLGAAASIATIIAAVFTVAAYYQGRSSEAGNLEPLVVDVPRKKLTVDPNPEIIFSDDSRKIFKNTQDCLLYTSPSPRDKRQSRMPSSA